MLLRLLAVAVLLLSPVAARAIDCGPPNAAFLHAPADGATDIPTNTILWVGFVEDVASQTLTKLSDGTTVTAANLRAPAAFNTGNLGFYRPARELEPGTTYAWTPFPGLTVRFTTGAGPSTQPPAVPVIRDGPSTYTPFCFGTLERIDVVSSSAITLLAGISTGTLSFPNELSTGSTPADTFFTGSTFLYTFWTGPIVARAATFDLAGQFSGWSEPLTIDPEANIPPIPLCSHFDVTAAWLPVLSIVAYRRRRNRPTASPELAGFRA